MLLPCKLQCIHRSCGRNQNDGKNRRTLKAPREQNRVNLGFSWRPTEGQVVWKKTFLLSFKGLCLEHCVFFQFAKHGAEQRKENAPDLRGRKCKCHLQDVSRQDFHFPFPLWKKVSHKGGSASPVFLEVRSSHTGFAVHWLANAPWIKPKTGIVWESVCWLRCRPVILFCGGVASTTIISISNYVVTLVRITEGPH